MDPEFEIATRPATPEFVLKVFQDWHRQASAMFEADPEFVLTFDSTIDEWRWGYDLAEWKEFAREMNNFWMIDVPLSEWKECMTPPRNRRVVNVCELIARNALVPVIRPLRILNRNCLPGGAFLTIKSLLKEAGANVEQLGPSTSLSDFTNRFPGLILSEMSRLAPGALPTIEADLRFPAGTFGFFSIALFFVAMPVFALSLPAAMFLAGTAIWLFLVGCVQAAKERQPATYGDIKTFKDLAKLIAVHSSESPHAAIA